MSDDAEQAMAAYFHAMRSAARRRRRPIEGYERLREVYFARAIRERDERERAARGDPPDET